MGDLIDAGYRKQDWPTFVSAADSNRPITTAEAAVLHICTIATSSLWAVAPQALSPLGLSAIVEIELQSVMNHPQGGQGRLLLLNAHAICWGDVSLGKLAKRVKKLNKSRSWTNQFGLEPIVRRRRRDGLADVLQLAHYIDKLPDSTKNRMPRRNKPGEYLFRDTMVGYRPEFALRVFEGLSHMTLTDAVFGVREGKIVRKAWKARVGAFHRTRPEVDRVTHFLPIGEFWRQARANNGSRLFEPFQVQ